MASKRWATEADRSAGFAATAAGPTEGARELRRSFLLKTLPAAAVAIGCGGGKPPQAPPTDAAAPSDPAVPATPAEAAPSAKKAGPKKLSLAAARKGFQTKIVKPSTPGERLRELAPPFRRVEYQGPLGMYEAYAVEPPPGPPKSMPIVIWITGGDCNTIDDSLAQPGPPRNDQTVSPFRQAGLSMLFPSLRGGNTNPGQKEGFYGELDDILAAGKFALTLPWVDPRKVYLGGHSTGGTMALLMACYADGFRAVFSFGPAADVRGYGGEYVYASIEENDEVVLRSPYYWRHSIQTPTFVFEGTEGGNVSDLEQLKKGLDNPLLHIHPVEEVDHFSILTPLARLIARKIHADTQVNCNIEFGVQEIRQAVAGV